MPTSSPPLSSDLVSRQSAYMIANPTPAYSLVVLPAVGEAAFVGRRYTPAAAAWREACHGSQAAPWSGVDISVALMMNRHFEGE